MRAVTVVLVIGYLLCGLGVAVGAVRWYWHGVAEYPEFPQSGPAYLPNSTLVEIVLLWPLVVVVAVLVCLVTLANEVIVRTGRRGRDR